MSSSPYPSGHPGLTHTRAPANQARTRALTAAWASLPLVPIAGVVAMSADGLAGLGVLVYLVTIGAVQGAAHIVLAVMCQVARTKAPDRPVPSSIVKAYAVYLLGFLGACLIFDDAGDVSMPHSPLRDVAVVPLSLVSIAALLTLFVLVAVDLSYAKDAAAEREYQARRQVR